MSPDCTYLDALVGQFIPPLRNKIKNKGNIFNNQNI